MNWLTFEPIPICLSVCLSVTLFGSWETQELLMLDSWNFIYGMYMKNKRTRNFFFTLPVLSFWSYAPFRLCMNNLVGRISEKLLRLGSWYLVTDQDVDELIYFWSYSVNFRLCYSPFSDTGILYRNNLVNKISEEQLWLGSWYLEHSYRPRCRWTD